MVAIQFKRRSDGTVVYTHTVDSSQTQFINLIQEGFNTSDYFKSLPTRNLQVLYFIGSNERSVPAKSTDSLVKLGLEGDGTVEFDIVFGRDYLVTQVPESFNSFDAVKDIVGLNRLNPASMDNSIEHCNYLVVDRRIFEILKRGSKIHHSDLFSCVRYSGISQRTTENLVKRFEEHGLDEKQFFMIELVRWDYSNASAFGFSTPQLASIGFEIGIAALHAAFSAEQNPGIGSVTLNVSAREVLDNNPYFYEMIYDIIIESLLDPKPLF